MRLFVEINRKGTTVLLATHEPGFVTAIGGRVLSLDRGRLVGNKVVERRSKLVTEPIEDEEDESPESSASGSGA